ncbi:MAG: ParB/RepB/Spo0J family partition protein [Nitrospirae bacterium]|nr:MAG: ParB-like protein partition protein [Leptospirillum sp. Group IV 'UBA BS']MCL4485833.1 ParB/RepB/Spo0J family partition protein [Nitrospirota bacterium]MCL5285262.1 ParB/RepB/Spo0J family partition protein [Nitrospirota bacterium]
MAKISLGRGIDSLYGEPSREDPTHSIAVSAIHPNPYQPRKSFSAEALSELASSLNRHGLLHPVIVVKKGEGYLLVSGERRLRAAEMIGWTEIPAIVREFSDQDLLEIALVENLKRSDLNPVEVATGLKRLSDEFRWTQENLSEYIGFKRSTVANYLRLLELDPEVIASISEGEISFGHAKVLSALTEKDQVHWKNEIIRRGLSVRALEDRLNRKQKPRPVNDESTKTWIQENRQTLERSLPCQAKITKQKKGWKVELNFTKMDELETMITRLSDKFEDKTEGRIDEK